MKRIYYLILSAGIISLIACGPSAEEKAAAEKAKQDSIAAAQKMIDDSVAAATAAAEKAMQDSINMAMQKAKDDSIAAAAEAKKHAAKPKPKMVKPGQPLPGRPGAVKK